MDEQSELVKRLRAIIAGIGDDDLYFEINSTQKKILCAEITEAADRIEELERCLSTRHRYNELEKARRHVVELEQQLMLQSEA